MGPTGRSRDARSSASTFAKDAYSLANQRALHRVAGTLSTSCRRLAAQQWVVPQPAREEHDGIVATVTEGLLDAINEQQVRDLFAYLRSTQPLVR